MNPYPIKRIRDLPADEQQPFTEWLAYQSCPEIEGVPEAEQDGYYEHDYKRWHDGLRHLAEWREEIRNEIIKAGNPFKRHDHGNPEEQKNKLVDEILSMFDDPHCWPMTDTQRIELLKHIYRGARKIRDTENAIKTAS